MKPQLKDIVLELAAKSTLVRILPLLVDYFERDILKKTPTVCHNEYLQWRRHSLDILCTLINFNPIAKLKHTSYGGPAT